MQPCLIKWRLAIEQKPMRGPTLGKTLPWSSTLPSRPLLLLVLVMFGMSAGLRAQLAPVALDDLASLQEDVADTVAVLLNDSDADGNLDSSSLEIIVDPLFGSASILADFQVRYLGATNYHGSDSLQYRVADSLGAYDSAWLVLSIDPVNDAPIILADAYAILESAALIAEVLDNDSDADSLGSLDTASLSLQIAALHGSATANTSLGIFDYVPDPDYVGLDSFRYQISDAGFPAPGGLTDSAWVVISITEASPVAVDDAGVLDEDAALSSFDVLLNDSDPQNDIDSTTLEILTAAVNGTSDTSLFEITYIPFANFNGTDSIRYRICDSLGLCDSAWLMLTINAVNDAPTAGADSINALEASASTANVLADDSDPLDPLGGIDSSSLEIITAPLNGSANVLSNAISYTSDVGFSGADSVQYRVADSGFPLPAIYDSAWLYISVGIASPTAVDDAGSLNEDETSLIDVLSNDTDPQNDLDFGSLDIISGPFNGSADTSMSQIEYSPDANYNGLDSLEYEICDSTGLCDTAQLQLTINAVNDAPLAGVDSLNALEGVSTIAEVLSDDSDPLDPLGGLDSSSLEIITAPLHGMASVLSNVITYTSDPGFSGADSLQYRVADSGFPLPAIYDSAWLYISVGVASPTAVDDAGSVNEDETSLIDVLANDTDPQNDLDFGTLEIISGPFNGSADTSMFQVQYTPAANFNGLDSLEYEICDSTGLCDIAELLLTINPVNDAPVAGTDSLSALEATATTANVLADDSDPLDPLGGIDSSSLEIITAPAHGMASVVSNSISYTSDVGFSGTDSLQYRVADSGFPLPAIFDSAWLYISVGVASPTAVDDASSLNEDETALVEVLVNDSDPQNDLDAGSLDIISGPFNGAADTTASQIEYTPNANFSGLDSLEYKVCDSTGLCDTAQLLLTISAVNDKVIALDDSYILLESAIDSLAVLDNDQDLADAPDGGIDSSSLSILVAPMHGTATLLSSEAQIRYAADPGYSGLDSIQYRIEDLGEPLPATADTAWARITILSAAPLAVVDSNSVFEDAISVRYVISNDIDPQDNIDPSSLTILQGPFEGGATPDLLGQITYNPNSNYNGPDSLEYRICDSTALCDSAWWIITVLPQNDNPVAVNDSAIGLEDTDVLINYLLNDSDPLDPLGGIDPFSINITSSPANGSLSIDTALGQLTYSPDSNWFGNDSWTYQICDTGNPLPAACDAALMFVQIDPVNDPPQVNGDIEVTDEDAVVSTLVLLNDSDEEDGTLLPATVSVVEAPNFGSTLVIALTGQINYAPDPDFNGSDSYVYEACDLDGLCDTARVSISVNPLNDAPTAVNDSVDVTEDVALEIFVLNNDDDALDPLGNLDPASLSTISAPLFGSLTFDLVLGTITYTPDPDYNGPDLFTYEICDDGNPLPALCDQANVIITVLPQNDPPVSLDDFELILEDASAISNVLINDTDLEDGSPDPSTLSIIEGPENGVATALVLTGQISYDPDADYNGLDSLSYRVCDLNGACDTAILRLQIDPVNDAPTVLADAALTSEDVAVNIDVLSNDNDDLDPLGGLDLSTLTIVLAPLNGSAILEVDATVTYTPDPDFNGLDSFRYEICDLGFPTPAICVQAWAVIDIGGVNDPPVLVDDNASGNEDVGLLVDVLLNDSDTEDGSPDPSSLSIETPPENGTAIVLGGEIQYDPDPNYYGLDSIEYEACDFSGLCSEAWLRIDLAAVNDAPVALDDIKLSTEDLSSFIGVPTNDSDPFDPMGGIDLTTVTVITGPFHGSATVSPLSGNVNYTPDPNYNGVDSFVYEICDLGFPLPAACTQATARVVLTPQNDAPVALDDADTTPEDTPTPTDVLANDDDPNDPLGSIDPTSVSIVSPPSNGNVLVNPVTGVITYSPDPGFIGIDNYSYQVCDDGNPLPSLCTTANVLITVSDEAPTANDDIAVGLEDNVLIIDVIANDTDPQPNLDTASILVLSPPVSGSTAIGPDPGEISYSPDANFHGTDLFTYIICDDDGFCDVATVLITMNPVNDPLVAVDDSDVSSEDASVTTTVIANDTDPQDAGFVPTGGVDPSSLSIITAPLNGSTVLDLITGSITYTPDPDFNGADFYTYQVCDVGHPLPATCDQANVLINVLPINDLPVLLDDLASVNEDASVSIDVTGNDFDLEDGTVDPGSVSVFLNPSNGTAVADAITGDILYTPDPDYHGSDNLVYEACDFDGACEQAVVNITVNPVNDAPQILDDVAVVDEDNSVNVAVIANDSDPRDPLAGIDASSVIVTVAPASGVTLVDPLSGSILYTPNPDFNGTDAFTYRVCDDGNPLPALCDVADVSITVNAINDAPIALDDSDNTAEDTPVSTDVLTNDDDPADPAGEIDPSSVIVLIAPLNGSTMVDLLSGDITYTPDLGFSGIDSYTYQVCDDGFPLPSLCDQAVVTINVSNESPVAVDDVFSLDEDSPSSFAVLANDSDPQDNIDTSSISIVVPPLMGFALPDPVTGNINYNPDLHFHGSDQLRYRICDLDGFCAEADLFLTINPVNDAPLALNDSEVTAEDNPVATPVLSNDGDPIDALFPPAGDLDTSTLIVTIPPSFGSTLLDLASGSVIYFPDPDFNGSDTYTYEICDDGFPAPGLCDQAVVVVNVAPVPDPPVAVDDAASTGIADPISINVLANDSDPDGDIDPTTTSLLVGPFEGSAVVDPITGIVDYDPPFGFVGLDSFRYQMCDATGLCDQAKVVITISATAPLVIDDTVEINAGEDIDIAVLSNDVEGSAAFDPSTILILSNPVSGIANADLISGLINYEPDLGFCGADSLIYAVCDENGLCGSAVVRIDVACAAIEAVDDTASVTFNEPVAINVLENDLGPVDPSCLNILDPPAQGTVEVLSDFSILYTPAPGFSGQECFSYTVCDSTLSAFDSAVVCVDVEAEVLVQVPVAFSPNNDGYNDLFVVPGVENWPNSELIIFSRWEELVFQASPYLNDWDGRRDSLNLPDGTYYYLLRLDPTDPNAEVMTGSINIIR